MLEAVINVIKQQNLLDNVQKTGIRLKSGLHELEKEFCSLINSVRGVGTLLAFDAKDAKMRDDILKKVLAKGGIS